MEEEGRERGGDGTKGDVGRKGEERWRAEGGEGRNEEEDTEQRGTERGRDQWKD